MAFPNGSIEGDRKWGANYAAVAAAAAAAATPVPAPVLPAVAVPADVTLTNIFQRTHTTPDELEVVFRESKQGERFIFIASFAKRFGDAFYEAETKDNAATKAAQKTGKAIENPDKPSLVDVTFRTHFVMAVALYKQMTVTEQRVFHDTLTVQTKVPGGIRGVPCGRRVFEKIAAHWPTEIFPQLLERRVPLENLKFYFPNGWNVPFLAERFLDQIANMRPDNANGMPSNYPYGPPADITAASISSTNQQALQLVDLEKQALYEALNISTHGLLPPLCEIVVDFAHIPRPEIVIAKNMDATTLGESLDRYPIDKNALNDGRPNAFLGMFIITITGLYKPHESSNSPDNLRALGYVNILKLHLGDSFRHLMRYFDDYHRNGFRDYSDLKKLFFST